MNGRGQGVLPQGGQQGGFAKGGELFQEGGVSDDDGQHSVSQTANAGLLTAWFADGGLPGRFQLSLGS
jgi:hypothetical protein